MTIVSESKVARLIVPLLSIAAFSVAVAAPLLGVESHVDTLIIFGISLAAFTVIDVLHVGADD